MIKGGARLEPRPAKSQDALLPGPSTARGFLSGSPWRGSSSPGSVLGRTVRLPQIHVAVTNYF